MQNCLLSLSSEPAVMDMMTAETSLMIQKLGLSSWHSMATSALVFLLKIGAAVSQPTHSAMVWQCLRELWLCHLQDG